MLICLNCGKNLTQNYQKKFCSTMCAYAYRKGKKRSPFSEEWLRHMSEGRRGEKNHRFGKHCSIETIKKLSDAKRGKHPTEETRRKMSISKKKENLSKETLRKLRENHPDFRGEKNPMYGKYHTKEVLKKMSENHVDVSGKNNPNWQDGKSFEPYSPSFNKALKEQIRARDNYTCQECGFMEEQLGYKLHCHHVDYNKKNNDPANIISLCNSCHAQTNFDREEWTEYYMEKILKCQ